MDSNRGGISASLGAKDLSGNIKKHRRRLKTEDDAEETDTPRFILLSKQAEWDANMVLVTLREPDNPGALIAQGSCILFPGQLQHGSPRRRTTLSM